MAALAFTLAFLGIVSGTEMVIHPLEEEANADTHQVETEKPD